MDKTKILIDALQKIIDISTETISRLDKNGSWIKETTRKVTRETQIAEKALKEFKATP